MDEFNNRMEAQRIVLNTINSSQRWREELFGLSKDAIERWARVNRIEPTGSAIALLTRISKKLFFLATKSQEQVSEDYRNLSSDITKLIADLKAALEAEIRGV